MEPAEPVEPAKPVKPATAPRVAVARDYTSLLEAEDTMQASLSLAMAKDAGLPVLMGLAAVLVACCSCIGCLYVRDFGYEITPGAMAGCGFATVCFLGASIVLIAGFV